MSSSKRISLKKIKKTPCFFFCSKNNSKRMKPDKDEVKIGLLIKGFALERSTRN